MAEELKEKLRQQEQEINILVQMLNKKGGAGEEHVFIRQNAGGALGESQRLPATPETDKPAPPQAT